MASAVEKQQKTKTPSTDLQDLSSSIPSVLGIKVKSPQRLNKQNTNSLLKQQLLTGINDLADNNNLKQQQQQFATNYSTGNLMISLVSSKNNNTNNSNNSTNNTNLSKNNNNNNNNNNMGCSALQSLANAAAECQNPNLLQQHREQEQQQQQQQQQEQATAANNLHQQLLLHMAKQSANEYFAQQQQQQQEQKQQYQQQEEEKQSGDIDELSNESSPTTLELIMESVNNESAKSEHELTLTDEQAGLEYRQLANNDKSTETTTTIVESSNPPPPTTTPPATTAAAEGTTTASSRTLAVSSRAGKSNKKSNTLNRSRTKSTIRIIADANALPSFNMQQHQYQQPQLQQQQHARNMTRPVQRRRIRRKAQSSNDDQAEHLTEMSVRGLDLFRYACIKEGVYQCTECAKENMQKTFKNKYSFQRHAFLYHEGKHRKVFPCTICGKEFSRPDKMKNHMKMTHDGGYPSKELGQFNAFNYLITAAAANDIQTNIYSQQQQSQQQEQSAVTLSINRMPEEQQPTQQQNDEQLLDNNNSSNKVNDEILKLHHEISIKDEIDVSPSPSPPPSTLMSSQLQQQHHQQQATHTQQRLEEVK